MKTLRSAAAAAALLAAGMPTACPAFAQAAPGTELQQRQLAYSEADARAVLNARLAALKTVMELTPQQEPLWPPVEAAIRAIVQGASERRAALPSSHFLDVLGSIAEAEEARSRALQRFIKAARPLADSLDDAQRRRIPAFLGMTDLGTGHQPSAQLWIFEEEEG